MHRWAGQFFHTAQDKKLCGCIELIVESRRVRAVWPGNVNDYSLSCACKQNSVAVYPILVFLRVFVCLPHLSVETTTAPLRSAPQEILASADAYPVEFQSLNLELSGRHLKFGRGSHIVTIFMLAVCLFARVTIEKPSLPLEALVKIK